MARSTCDPDVEAPEGTMKFEVIRSTVRDSIGQYCVPGDMAVLTPRHAKSYLKANYIRVPLPPGFADEDESDDDEINALLNEDGHAKPAGLGLADKRKEQVARQRAEDEAERERILAEARDEAARIVAEAKESAGPDTGASSDDSAGDGEESPTGGETGSSPDPTGQDEAERSPAKADPVRNPPKRRRRSTAK